MLTTLKNSKKTSWFFILVLRRVYKLRFKYRHFHAVQIVTLVIFVFITFVPPSFSKKNTFILADATRNTPTFSHSTPLINYGFYCKKSPYFDLHGEPQIEVLPPIQMSIFALNGSSWTNTLRLLIRPRNINGIPYNYLVLMAVNEKGLPVGHFHVGPCADIKHGTRGIRHYNEFCTKKKRGGTVGSKSKWESSRILFITPNKAHGQLHLGNSEEGIFWSWHKKDGKRPSKIQFRLAVIQDLENDLDIYWVNILSPVIAFQAVVKYTKPVANDTKEIKCHDHDRIIQLPQSSKNSSQKSKNTPQDEDQETEKKNFFQNLEKFSPRSENFSNFILAENQSELVVNLEFLQELFPDFAPKKSKHWLTSDIENQPLNLNINNVITAPPTPLSILKALQLEDTQTERQRQRQQSQEFPAFFQKLLRKADSVRFNQKAKVKIKTAPTTTKSNKYLSTTIHTADLDIKKASPVSDIFDELTEPNQEPMEVNKYPLKLIDSKFQATSAASAKTFKLVIYGSFCKSIKPLLYLHGSPQRTPVPAKVSIYSLAGSSNRNTLHIVVTPTANSPKYEYLVVMAVGNDGLPSGHFHKYACADAKYGVRGIQYYDEYCTRENVGWGQKWGSTRLMYVAADKTKDQNNLNEESIFWSWHPKDGKRPNSIQFRIAMIQTQENELDLYWIHKVFPVIEMLDDYITENQNSNENDIEKHSSNCYDESENLLLKQQQRQPHSKDGWILDEKSKQQGRMGNFFMADNQTELTVNPEFMTDLFPDLSFFFRVPVPALPPPPPSVPNANLLVLKKVADTFTTSSTSSFRRLETKTIKTVLPATVDENQALSNGDEEKNQQEQTQTREAQPTSTSTIKPTAKNEQKTSTATELKSTTIAITQRSRSPSSEEIESIRDEQTTGVTEQLSITTAPEALPQTLILDLVSTAEKNEHESQPKTNAFTMQSESVTETSTETIIQTVPVQTLAETETTPFATTGETWLESESLLPNSSLTKETLEHELASISTTAAKTNFQTEVPTEGKWQNSDSTPVLVENVSYSTTAKKEITPGFERIIAPVTLKATTKPSTKQHTVPTVKSSRSPLEQLLRKQSEDTTAGERTTISSEQQNEPYTRVTNDTSARITTDLDLASPISKAQTNHLLQSLSESIAPHSVIKTTREITQIQQTLAQATTTELQQQVPASIPKLIRPKSSKTDQPIQADVKRQKPAFKNFGRGIFNIANIQFESSSHQTKSASETSTLATSILKNNLHIQSISTNSRQTNIPNNFPFKYITQTPPTTKKIVKLNTIYPFKYITEASATLDKNLQFKKMYPFKYITQTPSPTTKAVKLEKKHPFKYITQTKPTPTIIKAIKLERTYPFKYITQKLRTTKKPVKLEKMYISVTTNFPNTSANNFEAESATSLIPLFQNPFSVSVKNKNRSILIKTVPRELGRHINNIKLDPQQTPGFLGRNANGLPQKSAGDAHNEGQTSDLTVENQSSNSNAKDSPSTLRSDVYSPHPLDVDSLEGNKADFYTQCGSNKLCVENPRGCLDTQSCTVRDTDIYEFREILILKLHGVFMIISWMLLIPNAVFIARYFKESYLHVDCCGSSVWFVVHLSLISTAGFFILMSIILPLVSSFQFGWHAFEGEEGIHVITGFVLLGVLVIQLGIGILRPTVSDDNEICKLILNFAHYFIGFVSYIVALILIGRSHLLARSFAPCFDGSLVLIWVLWSFIWHAVISIYTYVKDRKLGLRTLRAFLPWPMRKEVEDLFFPGNVFRTIAFAFHASGSGIIAALIFLPYLVSRRNCSCPNVLCWIDKS